MDNKQAQDNAKDEKSQRESKSGNDADNPEVSAGVAAGKAQRRVPDAYADLKQVLRNSGRH